MIKKLLLLTLITGISRSIYCMEQGVTQQHQEPGKRQLKRKYDAAFPVKTPKISIDAALFDHISAKIRSAPSIGDLDLIIKNINKHQLLSDASMQELQQLAWDRSLSLQEKK